MEFQSPHYPQFFFLGFFFPFKKKFFVFFGFKTNRSHNTHALPIIPHRHEE